MAARNVHQLNLRESEEMRLDREYLENTCQSLWPTDFSADCVLAGGDPSKEISAAARARRLRPHRHVDARSPFIKDMIYGSVANEVRHISRVPVLLGARRRRVMSRTPL